MKLIATVLVVAAFASVPLWLRDPYLMNALITTGIFIIGAMSLNLLLGLHRPTQPRACRVLRHRRLCQRADVAWLRRRPVRRFPHRSRALAADRGFCLAIVISGFCGYLVGRLSFRVRGAYFVIVTISFAEVVRLVALNWIELTQGPLALTNIPSIAIGLPGLGESDRCAPSSRTTTSCSRSR